MNLSTATSRSPDCLSNFRNTSSLFTFHYERNTHSEFIQVSKFSSAVLESSAMASFDSLPDEVALEIVKLAATRNDPFMRPKYDHDFLVDVLCRVSRRFKELATDSSLWKGRVWISKFSVYNERRACAYEAGWEYGRGKDRFVVEECLNSGTRGAIQ